MNTQIPMPVNGISTPFSIDENIAKMKQTLLKDIQRSAYVYRVDCGGCNGWKSKFSVPLRQHSMRNVLVIKVVASPSSCGHFIVHWCCYPCDAYASNACLPSCTRSKNLYFLRGLRLWRWYFPRSLLCFGAVVIKLCQLMCIPGCPPTPAATIYGFAVALGLLDQKLKGKQEKADPNAEAKLRFPTIPLDLRISLEREARRLAGYRQGGNIANQFMAMMTENDKVPFGVRLGEYLEREADPRLSEIVNRLHAISLPFSG